MSELRKKFIAQLELKGYSKRSISSYVDQIHHLSQFYNLSPDLLSADHVRDYMLHRINNDKVSKSSINQFISSWKIFYCEVLKQEWDKISIPRPRRQKPLPIVLSREEISRIFQLTINQKHRTILMLAYSSGLRIGEVIRLKLADIDANRKQIRIVQSKGFKDRYCVLSPVMLELLREYWKRYRPEVFLFESKPKQNMSERSLQYVFKTAAEKATISKKVSFHSLRHSYATHLMEQGVSLPIIQQLLGHKSLRTTSVYLHVQQYSIDTVKSPLDSLPL
jgi:site-specific recombinase XerD